MARRSPTAASAACTTRCAPRRRPHTRRLRTTRPPFGMCSSAYGRRVLGSKAGRYLTAGTDGPSRLRFERIYRRGRRAQRSAADEASTEAIHELRKRAKDLWHAAQVLRPVGPKPIITRAPRAQALRRGRRGPRPRRAARRRPRASAHPPAGRTRAARRARRSPARGSPAGRTRPRPPRLQPKAAQARAPDNGRQASRGSPSTRTAAGREGR